MQYQAISKVMPATPAKRGQKWEWNSHLQSGSSSFSWPSIPSWGLTHQGVERQGPLAMPCSYFWPQNSWAWEDCCFTPPNSGWYVIAAIGTRTYFLRGGLCREDMVVLPKSFQFASESLKYYIFPDAQLAFPLYPWNAAAPSPGVFLGVSDFRPVKNTWKIAKAWNQLQVLLWSLDFVECWTSSLHD